MNELWLQLIGEVLTLGFALASAIFVRWMLDMSTPEKDWAWVKRQFAWVPNPKWYKAEEIGHQLKARLLWNKWYDK